MKKLLLLLFLSARIATAQIVYIPDENFKNHLLLSGVDLDSDNEIQSTEALAVTVLNLDSSGISDLTGISAFTNLKYLDCSVNSLTGLDIQTLINLERLDCHHNQLESIYLPLNTNVLSYLDCSFNRIGSMNVETLTNLEQLYCYNNGMTGLNLGKLDKLEKLNCHNNSLSGLDLSQLPILDALICASNQLFALDVSSNTTLTALECSGNRFTKPLDITKLVNLKTLFCAGASLKELDVTKNLQLGILICFDNPLNSLDLSNNKKLTYLNCGGAGLTSILMKNGITETLILENSPDLKTICADEKQLPQILEQIVKSENSTTVVTSYCSFVPGGDFNTIAANARFDGDNNGCIATDFSANGVKFLLSGELQPNDVKSEGSLINPAGNASFYTGTGNFTVTPQLENPEYFTVAPASASVHFPVLGNTTVTTDFCMTAKGLHPDMEIVIAPVGAVRPGFDAGYIIVYKNKGNQSFSGTIQLTFDNERSDYVNSVPTINNQNGNLLIWKYDALQPFETRTISVRLNLNSSLETPALTVGDILSFTIAIDTPTGDNTPEDNTFLFNQSIIDLTEPYANTILEGDKTSANNIGEYLHYNIEFGDKENEKVGNVVVVNVIDTSMFDINTLQVIYASHAYSIKMKGNIVQFIFKNINLGANIENPGGRSTEEEGVNQGSILFKIKTLPTLSTNSYVSNKATIFFDYKAPIEINSMTTSFTQPLASEKPTSPNNITIYPNPVNNHLNIEGSSIIETITLFDLQGRLLKTVYPRERKAQIDFSTVKKGIHFVKITTANDIKIEKLMKD